MLAEVCGYVQSRQCHAGREQTTYAYHHRTNASENGALPHQVYDTVYQGSGDLLGPGERPSAHAKRSIFRFRENPREIV